MAPDNPTPYPWQLWITTAFALLGSLQFGYHMGVLNPSLPAVARDLQFTEAAGGAVATSALVAGAALGALAAGPAADAVGPRRALLWNNMLLTAGALLSAWAPYGLAGLVAGRTLAGLGAGAASLYVPRYVSETAPVAIRGALAAMCQVFICLGIVVAYVAGIPYDKADFTVHVAGHDIAWWRVMLAAGVLPAVLQAVGLAGCPESPAWLDGTRRSSQASAARQRLYGARWQAEAQAQQGQGPAVEEGAQPLLQTEAQEADAVPKVDDDSASAGSWWDVVGRRYRRMVVLAVGLPLLQQFSGINTVIFYSSEVFREAGLASPILGSIMMGSINVAGSLVAAALVDRAGRRPLLLLSHAAMAGCLLVLSLSTWLHVPADLRAGLCFAAILAYVLSFALGSGPIPWIYIQEVLPGRVRGRAGAVATCANWVANLAVGLTFPAMLQVLGIGGSYAVYAALNLAALVFVALLMVETKQQSIAHIKRLLIAPDP